MKTVLEFSVYFYPDDETSVFRTLGEAVRAAEERFANARNKSWDIDNGEVLLYVNGTDAASIAICRTLVSE